jgi:UDP-N-acetylmuramate--alanine ligase
VSEVDESDGSIALYKPEVAVLTNISLDHKELGELRTLFASFVLRARKAVLNLDDPETRALNDVVPADHRLGYGFDSPGADFMGKDLQLEADGVAFALEAEGNRHDVRLTVPGRHNASNALAAIAATRALGIRLEDAIGALARFEGLRRRLETVGTANGVTVIDDFAHNPDKIEATLATLRAKEGRVLIMFQPHGYGPIRFMRDARVDCFANGLCDEDVLVMPDPVYFGGTVDRSVGSDTIVHEIQRCGLKAFAFPDRGACGDLLVSLARRGDRIVVMGARDDSLSQFAHELLRRLAVTKNEGSLATR